MTADWQTISALATAAGTLVLALATFLAIRAGNRSARIAEQALLTAMRPLLVQSLGDDPTSSLGATTTGTRRPRATGTSTAPTRAADKPHSA